MPAPSAAELRREFLPDPAVAFLNHGSFGACPKPVFELPGFLRLSVAAYTIREDIAGC
ncbi:MAG: hypothetical protein ACJ75G_13085 [Gaiellaceae bacterium]